MRINKFITIALLISFCRYADANESQSLVISDLIAPATSISREHAFVFLREKDDDKFGSRLVDVLCSDGDVRLRVIAQNRIREFRSLNDFYCYSTLELARVAREKAPDKITFEAEIATDGEKRVMSSAIFRFSDGSFVDIYKVNGSTLKIGPLTEAK